MARQTIKKPITGQGGPRLSRPIFGLNCKIRQTGALIVGELLLAVAVLQCGQFTRLAGCSAGGLHPRSRSRYNPCLLAAGGAIQSQGSTMATTTWLDRGMSVPSCHQHLSTDRPLTPRRLPCRSSFSKLPAQSCRHRCRRRGEITENYIFKSSALLSNGRFVV